MKMSDTTNSFIQDKFYVLVVIAMLVFVMIVLVLFRLSNSEFAHNGVAFLENCFLLILGSFLTIIKLKAETTRVETKTGDVNLNSGKESEGK
jgi:heme/copper-type cytochrome/quinol oxidase subunit 2